MPPRRSAPPIDTERFMKRVEERIDLAFGRLLDEIEAVKMEVRKGNQETDILKHYVADVERQVIESRDYAQISARATAGAAIETASVLVEKTEAIAKKTWQTRLGLITTVSAAFVALVAIFNNLPKFVRGTSEIAVHVYSYIVRQH